MVVTSFFTAEFGKVCNAGITQAKGIVGLEFFSQENK